LSITVIGIPFAIRQLVRYQFMAPVTMLEGLDGRRSLARSSELVRKRWWHTALVVGSVYTVLGGVGLMLGLALLVVFTGLPLWTLSLIVTACNVLVMPLGAIAVTLLYGDAVADRAERAELAERKSGNASPSWRQATPRRGHPDCSPDRATVRSDHALRRSVRHVQGLVGVRRPSSSWPRSRRPGS
jgi:hypothetical protein